MGKRFITELLCQFADGSSMSDWNGMHADKGFVIRIEYGPFSRHAVDWVWPIQRNDDNTASLTCAHAEVERPNKSVVARPNVLEIDKQNIERFEHFRCWLAVFAVKTVNWNVQTGMLVTLPFHHVVLRLTKKSVLRTKQDGESKQIAMVSFENSRRVFKL